MCGEGRDLEMGGGAWRAGGHGEGPILQGRPRVGAGPRVGGVAAGSPLGIPLTLPLSEPLMKVEGGAAHGGGDMGWRGEPVPAPQGATCPAGRGRGRGSTMSRVPASLWGLLEEHIQPPERAEVKRILGEAAVDLSLELRAEAEILEALLEEERKVVQGSGHAPHPNPFSLLAPPPLMRDLVRRELRQLLCGLHQKAVLEGRDTAKAWARYSPKVLRFALGDPRDPVEDKLEARLPGSPGLSLQDLSAIKDCLNVANIDRVIQHLRTLLKEECCALEREIKALQLCLEDVHSSVTESSLMTSEPTLAELKEQKRAMEQDLLGPPTPLGLCPSLQEDKSQDAGWQGLGRQGMLSSKGQDLPFSGQQHQESLSYGLLPALPPTSHFPKPPQPQASGTSSHQSRWGRRLQCHSREGPMPSAGLPSGTPS
uniref:Coiled-coil domain-containing protein 24 isoform X2 n=1 Tax=Phascolarctos cinereus TaxID=38626 RepID=A0A6P5JIZ9_PHACI|nr:coiled-coil domain-containing protein 24 isoform X2 [Phascolarctos cinereus]